MASCFDNIALLQYNKVTKFFDVLIEDVNLKIEVTEDELILYISNGTVDTISVKLNLATLMFWKLSDNIIMIESKVIIKNCELNYFALEFSNENDIMSIMKLMNHNKLKANLGNKLIKTSEKLDNVSKVKCQNVKKLKVLSEVPSKTNGKSPKKVPFEVKESIVKALQENVPKAVLCTIFDLPLRTISDIYTKYNDFGANENKQTSRARQKVTADILGYIKELVNNNCAITSRSIAQAISDKYSVFVGINTINSWLKKLNISLKKINNAFVKCGPVWNVTKGVPPTL